MRIGFASETSIVSPRNLSHAYDSNTFQKLERDLKAHPIAEKTPSTKHSSQPRGPRFHRSPSHPTMITVWELHAECGGILKNRQATWPAMPCTSSDPMANEAKRHGMRHISDIEHQSLHQHGRRTKVRHPTQTHVFRHMTCE